MQLLTDVQIKKWKPKSRGDRASCGQSLYVQGWPNGNRAWVYRLMIPTSTGQQHRTVWLTIGHPAADAEHGIAGGALRLAEARELAMRISAAVKRGEASADQVKRALAHPTPLNNFEERLSKPVISRAAEIDYGKIPTFDEMFKKWYKMQMAANRWTHKASIRRPLGAYENHAAKAFGYLPINQISRRMVFETLQELFLEHFKTGKDLHCYCNEVFELAVDLEIIDSNPCPHKKKFTKPKRKVAHHGTIAASELPNLYQHVMNGKSDATFKAAMIALVVSGLRVANIAYLRQEHYEPSTGQFTIPEKDDDNPMVGLMKTGGEYSNIFPPEVRDMINEQLLAGHEFVFVSRHSKRHINPESLRTNFKTFDPNLTSHGFRNCFKEWGHHNDVNPFLIDRYTDHALKGNDAAYRRFDTLDGRADLARRYYAYMVTGVTPAACKLPDLKVVA